MNEHPIFASELCYKLVILNLINCNLLLILSQGVAARGRKVLPTLLLSG